MNYLIIAVVALASIMSVIGNAIADQIDLEDMSGNIWKRSEFKAGLRPQFLSFKNQSDVVLHFEGLNGASSDGANYKINDGHITFTAFDGLSSGSATCKMIFHDLDTLELRQCGIMLGVKFEAVYIFYSNIEN